MDFQQFNNDIEKKWPGKYQLADVLAAFCALDWDHSGTLSQNEVERWYKMKGWVNHATGMTEHQAILENQPDDVRERADRLGRRLSESSLLFEQVDRDGNGNLDRAEVRDLVYKQGYYLNDEELEGVMDRLDEDGDGNISLQEYQQWWTFPSTEEDRFKDFKVYSSGNCLETWIVEWFMTFDEDRNGRISADEFRNVYAGLRLEQDPVLERFQDCHEVLESIDEDKDGHVSYNEFMIWYDRQYRASEAAA
jgi:Ca2+-binding EF-hand superfamily protein